MSAQTLLSELRSRGVELAAEGLQLTVDAPAGAITEDLRAALVDNKPRLIRLLTGERRKLEAADKRGLIIKRSREPGYITLHDPLTGEWHDVKESECLPSVVADAKRKKGGAAM
jgi:hypothetical protein